MKPDYTRAAVRAMELLIEHNITTAPIDPLPVYKRMPGVLVLSFAEASQRAGVDRNDMTSRFYDAVTSAHVEKGHLQYLVSYNQRLPLYIVQRSLARELGHIALFHDGSRPESVRMEEAYTFALHFLFPRPLISAVQQSGIPLTVESLGAMTGCDYRCLQRMKLTPFVSVPAELNRKVRDQFSDYIRNFLDYESFFLSKSDDSSVVDIGTYMDGYEE